MNQYQYSSITDENAHFILYKKLINLEYKNKEYCW